jgi:hypothetical protein
VRNASHCTSRPLDVWFNFRYRLPRTKCPKRRRAAQPIMSAFEFLADAFARSSKDSYGPCRDNRQQNANVSPTLIPPLARPLLLGPEIAET